eukprot:sb/3472682/
MGRFVVCTVGHEPSDNIIYFLRYVVNPFLTERILGSSRLVYRLFPPLPPGNNRLIARTNYIPVSPTTLNLSLDSQTPVSLSCECGRGAGTITLTLRPVIPTMVVVSGEVRCEGGCYEGSQVAHIACSSSLTPDIFTSVTLLPYKHLVKELTNLDSVRFFFFK